MKHLIETADLSGLTRVDYNRIILDSDTDDIIVRGGGEGNPNGYAYIDLGLPSRLKWAKCNIGATNETDYGDYFMWGSTTPNTNTVCDWVHAPFNNGESSYNAEYFTAHKSEWLDDNDNLKLEYDAARAIMGGDWRMPTKDEIQELLDNTTVETTTINGVAGRKRTSKINGNSIFFPYSGYRSGPSFYTFSSGVLSSSLDTSQSEYVWYLHFSDSGMYLHNYQDRDEGKPVRGVL